MKTRLAALAVSCAIALLASCANAPPAQAPAAAAAVQAPVTGFDYRRPPDQPEAASGSTAKPGWATTQFAVAAANPLATDAGYQVLKAGGSAIDAAVAVQMVLGLVEPQSSGIGGGAFLVYFDGKKTQAFDGRETAPAAADEKLFIGADGKPLAFYDAVVGGRAVGVPGAVRMLELAHRQHGRLPWAALFEPAIQLAESGFAVSPRLNTLLAAEKHLPQDRAAADFFYQADGKPLAVGHVLRNPEYAAVLRLIAAKGSQGLLEGEVAQAIVNTVREHPGNPGRLALSDLAGYQVKQREPLCFAYNATPVFSPASRSWRICGMPPPSSGAIAIGQILGILSNTTASKLPLTPDRLPDDAWLYLYLEASRLAFADRALYVADPDFVQPPAGDWMSLLAPAYLSLRTQRIDQSPNGQSMKIAQPGNPAAGQAALHFAPMADQVEHGTSHVSIVDAYGNALAMTTTIEDQFGARLMVNRGKGLAGGFLLNNELTDFSFAPTDAASGRPIANRVQPGKRPRSSMAPTLVFDEPTGKFVMSAGSPGGALIIHYTAKTLYGVLNWSLVPQQAIDLPNFASLNGPSLLEENRFPKETVERLRKRGAEVREMPMTSGLQAIARWQAHGTPIWLGGADPRREGIVMGD